MNYNYAVGIPTINQWPSLKSKLELYAADMPDIPFVIIDNGNQGITPDQLPNQYQFNILTMPVNLGVAASWNTMIWAIMIDFMNALILNDDVYLGLNQDQVQNIINEHEEQNDIKPLLIHGSKGMSSFIINTIMFEIVGHFDIGYYPAYFEDNDYMERLKQKDFTPIEDHRLTPALFNGSQSIHRDPSLNVNFEKNKERFRSKWGYVPGE